MVRGVALAAVLAVCGAGCGPRGNPAERYVPSAEAAREALTEALTAWQADRAPASVAGGAAVQLVDRQRQDGRKLRSFAVLGEVPGEGPRCFAVRLALGDPEEEKRVRFVIVGTDPVWVFRHEDYQMLLHWECPMEDGKDAKDAKDARPPAPK
jgi:hypothetical protein